jgi:hypothetical protein
VAAGRRGVTTITDFNNLVEEQLGVPYVFGGISLKGSARPGLDCSGLPYAVAAALGVGIPRTSEEQFAHLEHVAADALRQGDLVYYDVASDTQAQPAHEGIVWGFGNPGTIIEAPHTGDVVRVAMADIYPIMGFRRLPFPSRPDLSNSPTVAGGDEVQVPTLKGGSSGGPVKAVQGILNAKAGAGLAPDGQFGAKTTTAVKAWQQFFHLGVDGVVGAETWSTLVGG